ncbi:hypothetical protein ONS96_007711 [Cadophora gregata f. sp. sojae]|nr:hypothetical protein ONS96_007711 [Cadophora gregata f. sp. sojae]
MSYRLLAVSWSAIDRVQCKMQIRRAIFLSCLITFCVNVSSVNLTEALQQIPPCALPCISRDVVNLPPSLTEPSSVCRNGTLEANAASCVLTRCPYTEQMEVAAIKTEFCEGVPIASRAWDIAIVGLVCGPIALIAVALRCYSRYSKLRTLGSDDWLSIAAGSILIP